MNRIKRSFCMLPCFAFLLAAGTSARADITSGTVYINTPDAANAADPANFSSSLASASFTIGSSSINYFVGNSSNESISKFLKNPTFTNTRNGFSPGNATNNSELVLTGSLYLTGGTNTLSIVHDDGVALFIPGIGYSNTTAAGGTPQATTVFTINNTNAAGLYNFTLDYSECCGGPAALNFTVPNAPVSVTPEPSSLLLLGTGVVAVTGSLRRRITQ